MNPFHRRAVLAAIALAACSGRSVAADLPTAKSLASEMGMGWNLGNTMELNGVQPVPTKVLFDSVKAAGFKTVRIPAAWDMHANQATYQIDAAWMAQVKKVVDDALAANLYVILNIHWDGGWVEGKIDSAASRPAMKATMYAKQGAYWRQIAATFKDYGKQLLFAGANEPGVDKQENLPVLMGLHQIFIDTVRASGGNNASRTLILPGPSTSFEHTADWITALPSDKIQDRLMVEAHFYPYQFCLMSQPADWGTTAYPFFYWGKQYHSTTDPVHNPTWGEEAFVDSQFDLMKPKYLDRNIPVVVGEFGALKRLSATGDNLRLAILSRRYFYNYVTKAALSRGMIPVAWDAGGKGDGTMTIFERNQPREGGVYDLGLLNAMRRASGQGALAGDTAADYTVATGDNAMRVLHSAKDSGFATINLGVMKADLSQVDSILVRAWFKGTTTYDSAGITGNGYASMSVVTMSKDWTWREGPFGQLAFDAWKTYSIPVSSDTSVKGALVPADRAKIDFFALQSYSKAYRGAIYIDWIAFKNRNGSLDTAYSFDEKAPEEGSGNVQAIRLVPTASVPGDMEWTTATTSKWGTAAIGPRAGAMESGLRAVVLGRRLVAYWNATRSGPVRAALFDPEGRTIWSGNVQSVAGSNSLAIPASGRGLMVLRLRKDGAETAVQVVLP